ncbi:hypothetical protein [Luteimicrobium subarcticum]|uniref:hypothetical protein n=1 Tax=Luteimicrobium subarcticum TaxID=620910 RepID=UPI0012FE508D|nr:hypothetical protein [Luteimicrobium subarcticum]
MTVVVVREGRKVVRRYAPTHLVDQAGDRLGDAQERARGFVATFADEFRVARAEREAELEAMLLADGQPDPAAVRAAQARGARPGAAFHAPDEADLPQDPDDPDSGYAFF